MRPAVQEHEEWGERTQNALLILGVIELVGLAMWKSSKLKLAHGVAAVGALICVGMVYETGEHGGTLVYSYAGGARVEDRRRERHRASVAGGLLQPGDGGSQGGTI